jgi:hypothetical protein
VTRIDDAVKVLRSKNAGIGLITVDVICDEPQVYAAVKATLTRERVAEAYSLEPAVPEVIAFDAGLSIKVVLPRPRVAGGAGLGETDLYGSGQYAPIGAIELPPEGTRHTSDNVIR